MSRFRKLALICLIATALPLGEASAHRDITLDKDDTEGPLDLVYAVLTHDTSGANIQVKAGTYEEWESALLVEGAEKRWVSFEFNLDADGIRERRIFITYIDSSLVAHMYGPGFGDPEMPHSRHIGEVEVWRPDAHSVKVAFSPRMLGRGVDAASGYRWIAGTSFEEDAIQSECAVPDPHGDGGYGTCRDFTRYSRP